MTPVLKQLLKLLARPWLVLAILTAVSFVAFLGIYDPIERTLKLSIDPSVDSLLPAGSDERQFFDQTTTQFGSDDTVVIALAADDVLAIDVVNEVSELASALNQLPGVQRVVALSDAAWVLADEVFVDSGTLADLGDYPPEQQQQARDFILSNPLYVGRLVSSDGRIAVLVADFSGMSDQAFQAENLVGQLRDLVDNKVQSSSVLNAGWITGGPLVKAETSTALLRSITWIMPLIVGLIAVLLLIAFRSVRGVLLPVIMISLALLWTLGLLSWIGKPLNLITVLIPPLIVTLGLAYAMHVLSEYYAVGSKQDRPGQRSRVVEMLNALALPMLLTGITTTAGLLALVLNPLPAIRDFAVFSAIGVAFTVVLALTFLPATLQLIGAKHLSIPPGRRFFDRLAYRLARFDVQRYRMIMIAAAVVFIASIAGITQIKSGTDYVTGFADDSRVRQDYEAIRKGLGGANPFSIVVDGYLDDTMVQPSLLRAIGEFEDWLSKQPEISGTVSLVDHVRVLQQSFSDGKAASAVIPDDAKLIKQLLVLGGPDDLHRYVNNRFSKMQIQAVTRTDETADLSMLRQRIEQRLTQLPEPLQGRVTGSSMLMTRTVDQMVTGQYFSVGVALLVIYIVLALLFTSRKVGLIALLPNALPVVAYYGLLGFSGVTLNPTTSLIACIVLGIAVDDTIHYLARFNADARNTASELKATASALRGVIRPVSFTSLALCLGFAVMLASDLRNQAEFGLLAAITLAFAWLVDVTFTPALASRVRIVTLWDVLRLDLGSEPQKTIPLFAGLSLRQARIFALLSNVHDEPAGSRVITEGDESKDIYVVIDGELDVWVENEGERVSLNTLSTGATIGEVGYFGQRRTANVDAISNVRLLRFNADDLDRLRRRAPRIAALVFRNLNRIQAARLARTVQLAR